MFCLLTFLSKNEKNRMVRQTNSKIKDLQVSRCIIFARAIMFLVESPVRFFYIFLDSLFGEGST